MAGDDTVLPAQSDFSNLRQKIEGNLKKSETKGKSKKPAKLRSDSEVIGKKRDSDGQIKQNGTTLARKETGLARNPQTTIRDKSIDLKSIIAELGGTEEDLELINGAESESEEEGVAAVKEAEPKRGKSLESGMANILKEIALVKDAHDGADSDDQSDAQDPQPVQTPKVNGDGEKSLMGADKNSDNELVIKSAATEVQKSKNVKSRFRFAPRPDWFNHGLQDVSGPSAPALQTIEHVQQYAKGLLLRENEAFKSAQASSSSQSFYNTVIASGTISDKISALTLAVQESPLHNMKALETLIGLARKRSRSQAVDVLRALKDLFAQGSMLPERRLLTFAAQPGLSLFGRWHEGNQLPNGVQEAHLMAWAFEDWLKEQYFEIVRVLETWSNDEIEFAKTRATNYIYELLKEKPEQEANLLRLLINKLGDPIKKIASQASYLVMQLLAHHPAMKETVISTLDTDFVFKPSQKMHARYYAAVTLNQTALSQKEESVALHLLNIYFGLFKLLLTPDKSQKTNEQDDELREKLTSAILTGVNRAYPYCGTEHQAFEAHLDTLFQITHSANFNTSIQAMMLIQQLVSSNPATRPVDRFYRTLYESLLDPRLASSSKQQLYLNLLHRALKADLNQKRVKAFVKRILQILSIQEPSFICGAFFLIKDLEKTLPSIATMIEQPEDHEEDEDYDASKRDPAFANADASCMWEVLPFLAHYHPSVSTSAEHTLGRKALPGKPDLALHTLIHFLDRFVYKNKVSSKMHGSSIMQPVASDTKSVLVSSAGSRQLAVNSAEFLSKKEVPAEDAFFHQYFKNIGKTAKKNAKKESEEKDDDSEDEIWQAMLKSGQDLELDEDEDEPSDLEGFEDEMASGDDLEMDDMDMDNSDVDIEDGIFDDSDGDEAISDQDDEQKADEDEESEFGGLSDEDKQPSKKTLQKREDRERKKKLKALPTFASAEDYMKMLEDDADEDMGL